jgi:hypothetical protein
MIGVESWTAESFEDGGSPEIRSSEMILPELRRSLLEAEFVFDDADEIGFAGREAVEDAFVADEELGELAGGG